ncbi:MAG: type 1 glutamine amidotransferase [Rhodospirillaceae bacterium]|nr:type 1 glutamine amidotransferase [Rhodospirillaceae bacterium]
MKFLVLQHIDIEHPGIFRDFMREDGVTWDAVELDDGERIPPLEGYDALISMGGPMDVFEEEEHPWLADEKVAIREAVAERDMPFLGVCLGHQLLADALGGRVETMPEPEVGIMTVELTEAGREDPLLAGLDQTVTCLQWHGCAVTVMPEGGVSLASSPLCAVQAFRIGRHAYGLQYHVELTPTTVSDWGDVPAYQDSLERALGPDGLAPFAAETARHMPAFNRNARILYDNFMALVRSR